MNGRCSIIFLFLTVVFFCLSSCTCSDGGKAVDNGTSSDPDNDNDDSTGNDTPTIDDDHQPPAADDDDDDDNDSSPITDDDDSTPCDDDDDNDNNDDNDNDDDNNDTLDPGLPWVEAPAGSFLMGCSPDDVDCNPDENPPHQVNVSAFKITAVEITQEQYETVSEVNPSYFTPAHGFEACPTCPVEEVTWFQARTFCRRVGGRLPSEAEWEYAARAGVTTRYYCGSDIACLDDIAWHPVNAEEHTHPVGGKDPNLLLLYDMLGNVWEWVNDWYDTDYYSNSPLNDPPGPTDGWARVLRGGSWLYDPDTKWTVSDRFLHDPAHSYSYIGFRCAKD